LIKTINICFKIFLIYILKILCKKFLDENLTMLLWVSHEEIVPRRMHSRTDAPEWVGFLVLSDLILPNQTPQIKFS